MADLSSSIEIKFKRPDKVYRANEKVNGVVTIYAKGGWSHSGVSLTAEGAVHLSLSTANSGVRGSETSSASSFCPKHQFFKHEMDIALPGKFAEGNNEVPFEFPVLARHLNQKLFESYRGLFVSVVYTLQIDCNRGIMKRSLQKLVEFVVEAPLPGKLSDISPTPFELIPESVDGVVPGTTISNSSSPRFNISGRINRLKCSITQPFTGELTINECNAPIRSVEIQLVRVESVLFEKKLCREATEIQVIQIGEGDICRGLPVPIHMAFPRFFSCPTLISLAFKVEFEVNLIVVIGDGYTATKNFPIEIVRYNDDV